MTVFEDSGQTLPVYTRLLIGVSNFVGSLLVLDAALHYGCRVWISPLEGFSRRAPCWDRFVLRVPLVGNLARILAVFPLFQHAGHHAALWCSLSCSLWLTSQKVSWAIPACRSGGRRGVAVREGESMARVMERSGEFPPLVSHMVAIGEKSGQLDQDAPERRAGLRQ